PFCEYHMADYFGHWLKIGKQSTADKLPKVFYVNWFRQRNGRWLWPGYGENSRVLKWVFERCDGEDNFVRTPIGLLPRADKLSLDGLNISRDDVEELLAVRPEQWLKEVVDIRRFYQIFGQRLPNELERQLTELEVRLQTSG
ncbi:MAG TPA: phosphoenolpyruvate carboxykinase domain-containing protein, partial [bacterium]|nr:phosphoenolpyruvate carboxykinase domain-containing protein [bacterium]